MKLLCARDALAEALGTVGRVVPTRSTQPVLTNVLLEADPADGLRLLATDGDLVVARQVWAEVEQAGRTTVPARLLADYVALLGRGQQVGLSLDNQGTRLHLDCAPFSAQIAILPPEDFPRPETPVVEGGTSLELDGAVLRQVLGHMLFAASPDASRPVLSSVLLRFGEGTLTLAASDSFRLALRTIDLLETTANASWVVPAATLREVMHALPRIEFSSPLVRGQYPDIERVIPRAGTTSAVLGTAELLRATRAAGVVARDDNAQAVRLDCAPLPDDGTPALGQVAVRAASAEFGDGATQLDASVEGAAGRITLNGAYLRDALEAVPSQHVRLQLSGSNQPAALRPVGEFETAYLQLVMPLLR